MWGSKVALPCLCFASISMKSKQIRNGLSPCFFLCSLWEMSPARHPDTPRLPLGLLEGRGRAQAGQIPLRHPTQPSSAGALGTPYKEGNPLDFNFQMF